MRQLHGDVSNVTKLLMAVGGTALLMEVLGNTKETRAKREQTRAFHTLNQPVYDPFFLERMMWEWFFG